MTQTRVTQEVLEAVTLPTPGSRVTQLVAEGVVHPTPPSRVTQLVVETLVVNRPRSRVSQLVLETIVPNAPPLDLGGVSGQLWPRGGDAIPGVGFPPGGTAGGDLSGTYPNPTVAKVQGIGYSTTDPTDGQAYVYDSGSGLMVPTTPSASVDLPIAPAGPKTAPVNANFAWDNQASATVTVSARDGSIMLDCPANAANQYTARLEAAPSTPYTVIACIDMPMVLLDFHGYGICFGNAGGTEIKALYLAAVSGATNLYVATTSGRAFGAAHAGAFSLPEKPKFMAIRDDGTNCKFYIGVEEENLIELHSHARATGLTPTTIGFFGAPRQATYRSKVTLFSWKKQSTAPG